MPNLYILTVIHWIRTHSQSNYAQLFFRIFNVNISSCKLGMVSHLSSELEVLEAMTVAYDDNHASNLRMMFDRGLQQQ